MTKSVVDVENSVIEGLAFPTPFSREPGLPGGEDV